MTCAFCDADVTEQPSVRVDFEGGVVEVCDLCMEKADEPETEPLFDWNREGEPAFSGAFNAW